MSDFENINNLNPTPVALITSDDKVAFYNVGDGQPYSVSLAQLQQWVLSGGTIDPVFEDLTCATLSVTGNVTVDTSTLKVDSVNNRVGIGTATPDAAFVVSTTNAVTANFTRLTGGSASPFQGVGQLQFGTSSGTQSYIGASVVAQAAEAWTAGSAQGTRLNISTTPNGTAATAVRVSIDQNGNVGVGTTTPSTTIDVNGATTLRGAVSFLDDATHDIGAAASARPRSIYTSADGIFAGVRVGRGPGTGSTLNTVAGNGSLAANTTGTANTAIGHAAMAANTTGSHSTAVGYVALQNNTTGENTALGSFALTANTTGTQNTAVGRAALTNCTTGGTNTAIGRSAMQNTTTSTNNVAVGSAAMFANIDATLCTAVGANALLSNASATGSATAIGYGALQALNGGGACTAVGTSALEAATTGNDNTAIGRSAGVAVTTGELNTIVGRSAGNGITTGSRNTIIGRGANPSVAAGIDQTVVGEGLVGKGNDTAFIGGTNGAYNEKNVTTWEVTSDERLKRDIVDNHDGLDKINAIRVRNFTYRPASEVTELPASAAIDKSGVQLGVIAQEMLPECVNETSEGVKSVSTDAVLWYLVNAVQQLHATVETLKQELGR